MSLPAGASRLAAPLLAALLAAAALVAPSTARADYSCGGQNDTCQCGKNNPYPCCDNGGNCTWWAWHSACCNWGVGLPGWGNANTWAQYAKGNGDFEVIGYPVPNSIATSTKGGYGHVAWVISVSGGTITVSEENCCGTCGWGMGVRTYSASYFNSGYIIRKGQLGQECNPGQSQSKGCGNCGSESRSCGSDGKWGGWGGCGGQGPCAPGQTQKEACGDCGEHGRSCSGGCQWNGWSACEGPDPGDGKLACQTGELGVCAEGMERCVGGWISCARTVDPGDELCDGLDNDCDGTSDEGQPTVMGTTPPKYAAELFDLSYPPALPPGGAGLAWADFRNVGTAAWSKGAIWLAVEGGEPGGASDLYEPGQWPAWDVAAVLPIDVEPGGTARLVLPLRAPMTSGATPETRMVLLDPEGSAMSCPSPAVEPAVNVVEGLSGQGAVPAEAPAVGTTAAPQAAPAGEQGSYLVAAGATPKVPAPSTAPVSPDSSSRGPTAGGCGASGGGPPALGAALFVLLLVLRSRSGGREPHPPKSRSAA